MKILSWIASAALLCVGSLLPAIWIGSLVQAIRAWRFLGYWPSYGRPDPSQLPEWLVADGFEARAVVAAFVLIGIFSTSRLRRVQTPGSRVLAAATIGLPTLIVGVALLWLDPGGSYTWSLD